MDTKILIPKIFEEIKRHPYDADAYEDLLGACVLKETEHAYAIESNLEMRNLLTAALPKAKDMSRMFDIYRKSLWFGAKDRFDDYLQFLEIDRVPSERFYLPRRKRLITVANALQDLADDKLDELFLSEPPRVGKTSMLMFFVTWLIGRDSEQSNLYCAYSDMITKAFYNGVLEILNDPTTYKWREVFPDAKIVGTNAQDETLNIDRRKRYPSLTCRSLYGTLNGACDCTGYLISDDLLSGIEEALNKDRLVSAWGKVTNNLLTRAKQKAKILWCGTRWSLIDPIGLRLDAIENDANFANKRFKVINLPALDENDESNFDYDYDVGFSTERFKEVRASFERTDDMASWMAQYMGSPVEREGALFLPEELKYYNGTLPEGEPDRVVIAVDPAFGGGDYVSAPICYKYGDDIFVHDVVFDNRDKSITQPELASAIESNGVTWGQFETTKSTVGYREGVEQLLRDRGYRCPLVSKAAPSNTGKGDRIFDKAPDIRSMLIFRESGKRSKEYELFMQNVFSYKVMGKNKHDDAPDSLAMMIDALNGNRRKAEIFKRTF